MGDKVAIQAAFETALNLFDPTFPTASPNTSYTPVTDTPYQEVFTMFARPENPSVGDGMYRQRGYFQIDLRYPIGGGSGAALAKGDAIEAAFPRGRTLTAGGFKVQVEETPEVRQGQREGDRFIVRVFVRFFANIME